MLLVLVPLVPGMAARARGTHLLWTGGALITAFAVRWLVLGSLGPRGIQQVLAGATPLERVGLGLGALTDYLSLLV